VLDIETDGLVGAVRPVVAAAAEVPGVVGVRALVLEDGEGLAGFERPGAGAGLAANANRREPQARGGRKDRRPETR